MTQAITPSTETLTPAKWTLDEYHQMISAELLIDRRVELLNGVIVEMPPLEPIHEYTEEELVAYLRPLLKGHAKVREAKAITLPDKGDGPSEPIPDISVVKDQRYRDRHPYPEDIYLLIEVANSQPARDLQAKRLIYAKAGIAECWVFDLQKQEMRVFRGIQDGDYQSDVVWELDTITIQAFPDVTLSANTMKRLANEPYTTSISIYTYPLPTIQ